MAPKIAKNNSSTSAAASLGVTTRSMSRAKGSSLTPLHHHEEDFDGTKSSSSPSSPRESHDATSVIRHDMAMTTNDSTPEEQMATMLKMIEALSKRCELQDARMNQIMSRLEASNESSAGNKPIDVGEKTETSTQRNQSKGK